MESRRRLSNRSCFFLEKELDQYVNSADSPGVGHERHDLSPTRRQKLHRSAAEVVDAGTALSCADLFGASGGESTTIGPEL